MDRDISVQISNVCVHVHMCPWENEEWDEVHAETQFCEFCQILIWGR